MNHLQLIIRSQQSKLGSSSLATVFPIHLLCSTRTREPRKNLVLFYVLTLDFFLSTESFFIFNAEKKVEQMIIIIAIAVNVMQLMLFMIYKNWMVSIDWWIADRVKNFFYNWMNFSKFVCGGVQCEINERENNHFSFGYIFPMRIIYHIFCSQSFSIFNTVSNLYFIESYRIFNSWFGMANATARYSLKQKWFGRYLHANMPKYNCFTIPEIIKITTHNDINDMLT